MKEDGKGKQDEGKPQGKERHEEEEEEEKQEEVENKNKRWCWSNLCELPFIPAPSPRLGEVLTNKTALMCKVTSSFTFFFFFALTSLATDIE